TAGESVQRGHRERARRTNTAGLHPNACGRRVVPHRAARLHAGCPRDTAARRSIAAGARDGADGKLGGLSAPRGRRAQSAHRRCIAAVDRGGGERTATRGGAAVERRQPCPQPLVRGSCAAHHIFRSPTSPQPAPIIATYSAFSSSTPAVTLPNSQSTAAMAAP